MNSKINFFLENKIDKEKAIVDLKLFDEENDESGFALLKGNNWSYYMKKFSCILGRGPNNKHFKGNYF